MERETVIRSGERSRERAERLFFCAECKHGGVERRRFPSRPFSVLPGAGPRPRPVLPCEARRAPPSERDEAPSTCTE